MSDDGSPAPDNVVDLRDYDTAPAAGLNPVQFAGTASAPAPSVAPAPGRTLPTAPSYPPPPTARPTPQGQAASASASLGPQFKLQGAHAVASSAKRAAEAQSKAAATPKSLVRETHGWSHS